jgi:TFIIF-interacting CTD phosphatase-like protein
MVNNEEYLSYLFIKGFELGTKTKPKVLIFDMDETLISAWRVRDEEICNPWGRKKGDFSFMFDGRLIEVKLRPYVIETLERLAESFEIVVYTAGIKGYADPILDRIDPMNTMIMKRLYRHDCMQF